MRLSQLLKNNIAIPETSDCEISALTSDSRQVHKNTLFLAVKGTHQDGRTFIPQAIAKGAAAVLYESSDHFSPAPADIPLIPYKNLQAAIGYLAAGFYAHPAKKLQMFGVTGTSGKTSCTHFIAQILTALNMPCGLIGTLGNGYVGHLSEANLTTPDAITLQAQLAQFAHAKARAVAMEVSSHSIDQARIHGIQFAVGVFTNLSQDHLDYHGTMENYARVKGRFLQENFTQKIVINADDAYGLNWINELADKKPVYAYSLKKTNMPANIPLVYADHIHLTLSGITAVIHSPWGEAEVNIPLIGEFNLSNVLATITALCAHDIPFADVIQQVSTLKPVAGRMQLLAKKNKPLIVVDYAHKPDALLKVLSALRAHTQGKLICVFGCGGDRDRGKRPLMAKVAEKWADKIIVTNDNPRNEKPEGILAEIMQGFTKPETVSVELDRAQAIENSIRWAEARDCVLIAGKGAEHYQQIGDEKLPFDDVEIARKCLE